MRRTFVASLASEMESHPEIVVLTADLGYGMFDNIRDTFPDRFLNCGASEQAMLDIACGLALEGKNVFAYSITPFIIFRAMETIRTYINHEKIPVKLIGSGYKDDYKHDGFSHSAFDVKRAMDLYTNIQCYWPADKRAIDGIVRFLVRSDQPAFLCLRR